MKTLLLPLLPALLCCLVSGQAAPQEAPVQLPEVPRAIDTPQGKLGPLGVTFPEQHPIVSVWLDLSQEKADQLRNMLQRLGWSLDYTEATQRWISGEGQVELHLDGVSRPALLSVGDRLLLRGTAANVAALQGAIEALLPKLDRGRTPSSTYMTLKPRYLSPETIQRVANVLTDGRLQMADGGNGSLVIRAELSAVEGLMRWLQTNDQPPPEGTLVLDAFVRVDAGQAAPPGANELPAKLAAGLEELFPGQRFVRAEGAMAAFSAASGTPLSLATTLSGLGAPGAPAARLRLDAEVGNSNLEQGALGLRRLLLQLDLPVETGVENHSLSTELVLTPGEPTLLGSLNGNRVLFVLRLVPRGR